MNKLMLSKTKQELNDDKTISSLIQSAESWTVDLPSSIPYSNNEDDVEFGFELHDDGIDRLTHSTSSFQSIESSKLSYKKLNLEENSNENVDRDEEEERKNKRIDSYKNFKELILNSNNQNFFRSGESFKIKEIPSSMTLEFLQHVSKRRWVKAYELCKKILKLKPGSKIYREYIILLESLIKNKNMINELIFESQSSASEDDDEGDEDDDGDEDNIDLVENKSQSEKSDDDDDYESMVSSSKTSFNSKNSSTNSQSSSSIKSAGYSKIAIKNFSKSRIDLKKKTIKKELKQLTYKIDIGVKNKPDAKNSKSLKAIENKISKEIIKDKEDDEEGKEDDENGTEEDDDEEEEDDDDDLDEVEKQTEDLQTEIEHHKDEENESGSSDDDEIEMCNDEEYEIIEHVNEPDDPKDV